MSLVIPAAPAVTLPVLGGGRWPARRVYCVARNYEAHAQEMGFTGREPPFFFMKPTDALLPVTPNAVGELPYPAATESLHHEVELVVAIGRGGADIAVDQAAAYVWGYAVGLDMTRRDLQAEARQHGRPWEAAKAFDHSAPIGPIVAAGDASAVGLASIALTVNGTTRQAGSTADLVWKIAEIIAHLSALWRLEAGDLIFTGTPAGVGPVVRGDLIEAQITGLPRLAVRVV